MNALNAKFSSKMIGLSFVVCFLLVSAFAFGGY